MSEEDLSDEKAAAPEPPQAEPAIPIKDEPRWSDEPILLGTINGVSVEVPVPQNDQAVKQMNLTSAVALVLVRRIQALELEVKKLRRRVNYED